jgi:hypothetical protein
MAKQFNSVSLWFAIIGETLGVLILAVIQFSLTNARTFVARYDSDPDLKINFKGTMNTDP